jgi:ElaB/YqjD/DUF883 family membrane-anchored ribosome-binding protein
MATTTTTPTGAREDLQSELANLKGDLRKVKDDLRSIADALMDQGRSSASAVRDRVQERMETGVETLQEYLEQRPITSLLIVLGVGLVIGKLMTSK